MAVTAAELIVKYGSVENAAGAIALAIEQISYDDFVWFPESFRSAVLFAQQRSILLFAAASAGVSLATVQQSFLDEITRRGVRT